MQKDKSGYEIILIAIILAMAGYGLATLPVGCGTVGAADVVWLDGNGKPDTLKFHDPDDYYLADTRYPITDSVGDSLVTARITRYMARKLRTTVLGTEVKLDRVGRDALVTIAYRYSTTVDTVKRIKEITDAVENGLK